MLLEEFLKPMGLSQRDLADGVHVPYQRVNELVNGRRGVTAATALRLAKFFGTRAGFWMNLQIRWDLFHAERAESAALATIQEVEQKKKRRVAGMDADKKFWIADDFDAPLPPEIQKYFE